MEQCNKKELNSFKAERNQALKKAREELENKYKQEWQAGCRMIKSSDTISILAKHFELNPFWNYEKKILIAEEVGMTYMQVSKWCWDEKQRQGISTKRAKL